MAVLDNNVYFIGGDLDNLRSDEVFRWNVESNTLSDFANLPQPRVGARGTIVNNDLYIFGGTDRLLTENEPYNSILKLSLDGSSEIETFEMNKGVTFTFVQKYQNLIYVAGRIDHETGSEATVGVFNTLDNTYRELQTNLTNESGFDTIHQMCVTNGKMYIVYGGFGTDNGGQLPEWEILVSDL